MIDRLISEKIREGVKEVRIRRGLSKIKIINKENKKRHLQL